MGWIQKHWSEYIMIYRLENTISQHMMRPRISLVGYGI